MAIMLLLALPLSFPLAAGLWQLVDPSPGASGFAGWVRATEASALVLLASGPVAALLVSVAHTCALRRIRTRTARGEMALAAALGAAPGALLGTSWSADATLTLAIWGAGLGLLYGLFVSLLDRAPTG